MRRPRGRVGPDFGPNVLIFDPSMSSASIQSQLDTVYTQQDAAQFGTGRYAFFFKPGAYALDVKVGFYTQVLGLGQSPDDVTITGAVRSKADWLGNDNATCNFWRGAENLAVVPTSSIDGDVNVWAVSQGTHLRRVHVKGNLVLDDSGGWSSGGFIADSLVDGSIDSGSQQQFLTRNVDGPWTGSNWNMVFVGDGQPPSGTWPSPPYTVAASTPVVRERPFLYVDAAGHYLVMVPSLKKSSTGPAGPPARPGRAAVDRPLLPGQPGTDTAATMNAALAHGQHLMLTPGIYHLASSLQVTQPGRDRDGSGLRDAHPRRRHAGAFGRRRRRRHPGRRHPRGRPDQQPHAVAARGGRQQLHYSADPTMVFDVHCRVGGADAGKAASCVTVTATRSCSTTCGCGAPTTAPAWAGPTTPAPTASSSTATT